MADHHRESNDCAAAALSMLAGLAVGLAIGVAVSLLYAPKSGRETREELASCLQEMRDRLDETAKRVTEAAKARIAETGADLAQAIDAGRVAASERKTALRKQAGIE